MDGLILTWRGPSGAGVGVQVESRLRLSVDEGLSQARVGKCVGLGLLQEGIVHVDVGFRVWAPSLAGGSGGALAACLRGRPQRQEQLAVPLPAGGSAPEGVTGPGETASGPGAAPGRTAGRWPFPLAVTWFAQALRQACTSCRFERRAATVLLAEAGLRLRRREQADVCAVGDDLPSATVRSQPREAAFHGPAYFPDRLLVERA